MTAAGDLTQLLLATRSIFDADTFESARIGIDGLVEFGKRPARIIAIGIVGFRGSTIAMNEGGEKDGAKGSSQSE